MHHPAVVHSRPRKSTHTHTHTLIHACVHFRIFPLIYPYVHTHTHTHTHKHTQHPDVAHFGPRKSTSSRSPAPAGSSTARTTRFRLASQHQQLQQQRIQQLQQQQRTCSERVHITPVQIHIRKNIAGRLQNVPQRQRLL
jgi:hypothetical protein